MADTFQSLEISAARDGGYIVWAGALNRGEYREPLYAGTLKSALEFAGRSILDNEPKGEG